MAARRKRPEPKAEPAAEEHEGLLSTHELKQRGWTATLIRDFLGAQDATRPNRMRLGGRRKLPPVRLYDEDRVRDAESTEEFLIAQGRAMDARDRAERAQATRTANRAAKIDAAVSAWRPVIEPVKVRRGAHRKAFAAHEEELEAARARAAAAIGNLTRQEARDLDARLREKYLAALRHAYPWLDTEGT